MSHHDEKIEAGRKCIASINDVLEEIDSKRKYLGEMISEKDFTKPLYEIPEIPPEVIDDIEIHVSNALGKIHNATEFEQELRYVAGRYKLTCNNYTRKKD